MRVRIPSPLHSYTAGAASVDASGGSLSEVVTDLEGKFPGLRFRIVDEQERIRPHIRFFVGGSLARDLSHAVGPADEVMIVAALSGG